MLDSFNNAYIWAILFIAFLYLFYITRAWPALFIAISALLVSVIYARKSKRQAKKMYNNL